MCLSERDVFHHMKSTSNVEFVVKRCLVGMICSISRQSATVGLLFITPSLMESLCIWRKEADALQRDGGVY